MCEFLSAIGIKNGDILCDPSIDSHEDLIKMHGLKDTKLRNWVRIEFYPKDNKDYHLIDKYGLHIDDDLTGWINDGVKDKWINKLKAKLNRIIITDDTYCLPSGTYILTGGVFVERLMYCRILYANSATIKNANSATIENADSATIKNANFATIKNANSATIINK